MRDTEKLQLGTKSQVFCLSSKRRRTSNKKRGLFLFSPSIVLRGKKNNPKTSRRGKIIQQTNIEKETQKSGPKVNCPVKKTSSLCLLEQASLSLHVCSADLRNLRTGVIRMFLRRKKMSANI